MKLYDKIVLKTGETAYIVEILEVGKAYLVDVDHADGSISTEFATQGDFADMPVT